MPHSVELITTIAAALGLALIFGFIAVRLRLPALVGYLLAGIVIGPFTPGFVADTALAGQLAEIGVMLLMFGVGLHFSLDDLLSVKKIALPGAVVQIAVVLLKALESLGALATPNGRIAVGWLIVEDLVMVMVLVLLPPLAQVFGNAPGTASGHSLLATLAITLGEVALFIGLMLVGGRRFFPWLLWQVARTGSRELFTLCVVAAALGIAYGSSVLFGVSFALGAFFAGMVLRESALSYRAAEETLPLRDAFAVLFFVSVGMLFDPSVLLTQPLHVLAVVAIIVFGKSLAAFLLVLAFRYPLNTALTVSASLAQIGEFSFILAGLGVMLGVLPAEGQSLILAGALISIALNPLVFTVIEPAQTWIRARSKLARKLEQRDDPLAELPADVTPHTLTGHIVLAGYGRVGRHIAEALDAQGQSYVVAEQQREEVEKLRTRGIHAVVGDASEPAVLIQAHIARALMLVIAIPDAFQARKMIEIARTLNPRIHILVRSHCEDEAALLRREQSVDVLVGERELANSMVRRVSECVKGQAEAHV
ncbi:cation:proton antiporter [Thiobacillus sp.]|uniref:cation:proton antiporter domain-containing protein n=1 Tax=Thiobacillus sp. TaxID=924 RepID=UPI0018550985|nr:cation:proton antiporter [Thiobacillus sp.]MBC2730257.1 sodium:proton antiporter [Thiobacillus sp.]MBC2738995.1 cation:proton antiporter [Thiobacillus sp.]